MNKTADRQTHITFWYVLLAIFALLLVQSWWTESSRVTTVPYSEFQAMLADGKLESVSVSATRIRGRLKQVSADGHESIETIRIEPEFARDLATYDVEFSGVIESDWLAQALSWVLPVAFFVGIWMFFIRRLADRPGMGGLMSVGKSKAKVYVEKDTKVSFDDVAGVDEAKAELAEIVSFLKDSTGYGRLGARIPKGVLLVGPPGRPPGRSTRPSGKPSIGRSGKRRGFSRSIASCSTRQPPRCCPGKRCRRTTSRKSSPSKHRVDFMVARVAFVYLAFTCVGEVSIAAPQTMPVDAIALHAGSPFLRLLGLPRFETERPSPGGSLDVSLDIVNHADRGSAATESIVLDGESLYLDIVLRKRMTDRLTLGMDVPFINHSSGSLDNVIEAWHELFGLTNANRDGPANELAIAYSEAGRSVVRVDEAQGGLGDVKASVFWQVTQPGEQPAPSLAVTAQVELPTGDTDSLFGNGATDVSIGLLVGNFSVPHSDRLSLSAAAGVTWPGNGDLVETRRRPRIAYGGVDLIWEITGRWQAHATIFGHAAGFDSDLPELGRGSLQLAIAGRWQPAISRRLFLDLGFVEDLVSDSTPDFAVHLALRGYR